MTNQTKTGTPFIIVQTTCSNHNEARQIQESLITQQLAACIQMRTLQSCYAWQGKIENAQEYKLEIKTQIHHFDAIQTLIQRLSSYDCPEIIALPILKLSEDYANWLTLTTTLK